MFKTKTLKPGTYRLYILSDGQYRNMLNLLAVFHVTDGRVDWTKELPLISADFDDDFERSSISTSAFTICGDHNCSHVRFKSYGEVDLSDGSGYGYARTAVSDDCDLLQSPYKGVYDYHGRNYTEYGYSGPTTFQMSRTDRSTHFERHWRGYNGNRWDEIKTAVYTFGETGYTVTVGLVDLWNGNPRQNYTRTYTVPYSSLQGSQYLDFTVNDSSEISSIFINRWKTLLKDVPKFTAPAPSADVFGAALEAARDFNAYDLNLIEALAGFSGINDLLPADLSKGLLKEIEQFCESPSLLTAFTRTAYLASCTYLYSKYVTGNNIADIEQILGLSGSKRFADAMDIAQKISASIDRDTESDWDFRLAKMAQKIVYKYDYRQDSYGSVVERASNATDVCTMRSTAHLCATPGPLRDMSTSAIILDDIGLSLRASRVAQAVKLEFVANWFLPIEENLDRIEFNNVRLNQLYSVKKLCTSTKETHSLVLPEILPIYGLQKVTDASIYITEYHRQTSDEFPPTTLKNSVNTCLSVGRLMQGSALIVSALGK